MSSYTLFLIVVSNGDYSPGSDETMVGYVGQGSDSGRFYAQANSVWETNKASATAVASLRCSVDGDVLSNSLGLNKFPVLPDHIHSKLLLPTMTFGSWDTESRQTIPTIFLTPWKR